MATENIDSPFTIESGHVLANPFQVNNVEDTGDDDDGDDDDYDDNDDDDRP